MYDCITLTTSRILILGVFLATHVLAFAVHNIHKYMQNSGLVKYDDHRLMTKSLMSQLEANRYDQIKAC